MSLFTELKNKLQSNETVKRSVMSQLVKKKRKLAVGSAGYVALARLSARLTK